MKILGESESNFATCAEQVEFVTVEECLEKVRKIVEEQLEYLKDREKLSSCIYVEGWYILSSRKKP